jgi:hypothetical protein
VGGWALRDARRGWLQVTSIGLLLALGVGMYSAMSSMAGWRTASADASVAALRCADLRVSLVSGSYANTGQLSAARWRESPTAAW